MFGNSSCGRKRQQKPPALHARKAKQSILYKAEIFEEEQIVKHVQEISIYLEEKLNSLVENNEFVETRRGKGLMQGLVLKKPVGDVVKKAMEQGLIVISAGGNVLRLVPPLTITESHVDEMIEKLEKALSE